MEITVNGHVLKSSDYRIVGYGQNTDVFSTKKKNYGTVTIEGTGNYTGRATLKFRISHMAHEVTTWDEILELFGYKGVDGYAVPVL